MKFSFRLILSVLVIFSLFYFVACNNGPTKPKTGILLVSAVDNDLEEPAIKDIEITISPGNIVKTTDENGECLFELEPGDYILDTEVCCVGAPGEVPYQEQITLVENDTVEVILPFCLSCE
ncbi:MAG: hypothetical protein GXO91_04330 [FCB group bacterium]|nr:hypothetical protein [FCB group bacterium]